MPQSITAEEMEVVPETRMFTPAPGLLWKFQATSEGFALVPPMVPGEAAAIPEYSWSSTPSIWALALDTPACTEVLETLVAW